MKNLWLVPDILREHQKIKAAFVFDWEVIALCKIPSSTHWSPILVIDQILFEYGSNTSLANIKSPLGPIIDQKSTDNKHIT